MADKHEDSTFLDSVDSEMHDSILRLDQKLKGLQAEISAKIEAIANDKDKASKERKEQLITLEDEVNKAITSIKNLVNLVVSDELTAGEFSEMNKESLDGLRAMFKDNTDKISKIKEEF